MKFRMTTLTALAFMALAVAGCRSLATVNDIENAAYAGVSSNQLTLDDYQNAIIRAGSERGWRFSPQGPGKLIGDVSVRGKHKAQIEVTFDTETYSIRHLSSENLKYDSETNSIHPNYNQWINLLEADIQNEIQRLRAS